MSKTVEVPLMFHLQKRHVGKYSRGVNIWNFHHTCIGVTGVGGWRSGVYINWCPLFAHINQNQMWNQNPFLYGDPPKFSEIKQRQLRLSGDCPSTLNWQPPWTASWWYEMRKTSSCCHRQFGCRHWPGMYPGSQNSNDGLRSVVGGGLCCCSLGWNLAIMLAMLSFYGNY